LEQNLSAFYKWSEDKRSEKGFAGQRFHLMRLIIRFYLLIVSFYIEIKELLLEKNAESFVNKESMCNFAAQIDCDFLKP